MARELDYTELWRYCEPAGLGFETTDELAPLDEIIGQERAVRAMRFGLGVKAKGYNIYVSGVPGLGKTTFARRYAIEQAGLESPPSDLCYIYNFKEPMYPRLLTLNSGAGRIFKDDMEELVALLGAELQRIFSGKEFESHKNGIVNGYKEKSNDMIRTITENARDRNFGVRMSNSGMYFLPRIDGEMISEEQFDALPDEERDKIAESSEVIQSQAAEVMDAIKQLDRDTRREIDELQYSTGLFTVGYHMGRLQRKYDSHAAVLQYLALVKEDILENLGDFWSDPDNEDEESLLSLMPWVSRRGKSDALTKYMVNLITDNSGAVSAPVIVSHNPTYANLVGEIEYDSEFGNLVTDFMKIKPGLLHKANGGYLILQTHDVLSAPYVWETLRKSAKTGEVTIEPLREYASGIAMTGIRPENAPVSVKIILVGSHYYYSLLREVDSEFQKLFKINAFFDYELEYGDENVLRVARMIKKFTEENGMKPFSAGAVARVMEHSVRIAENQNKLSAQFDRINEILIESSAWAAEEGADAVGAEHVERAVAEREYRHNVYEEKLNEIIENNIIMLDTTGSKTGQINGLAVLDTGDYAFAKPTRITATTYLGKAGIVNVEKEAELSGEIHDKGVQILTGYLGQKYAQDFPLSLSCRICFEQNYNGIDGDSASSTELYAVLSSLSDAPINQELAVTGSINQRGEIQAIGGVTYKVEGFFDLCSKRGLTGTQGVIIPRQNVRDLALKRSVVDAVREGAFHIYAIGHVDEGLELLTGLSAGVKEKDGGYPPGSVHGRVLRKLRNFHDKTSME